MAEVDINAETQPKVEKPPSPSASDLHEDGKETATKPLPTIRMDVAKEGWRAVQGQNDWKELLDPIHLVVRSELIRYGEFANSTYDGFDSDQQSRFCGTCKYSKERLLNEVGLPNTGYEVRDQIYATAGKGVPKAFLKFMDRGTLGDNDDSVSGLETNWMGYVAVSVDEQEIRRLGRRDILVVWRGTVDGIEWTNDLQDRLDRLGPSGADPRWKGESNLKVEQGFLSLYTASDPKYNNLSARQQVLTAVKRLVKQYEKEELSITVTGHSLGAALAILCAYDIAESSCNQPSHLPDRITKWSENQVKKGPQADDVVNWTNSEHEKTVPVTVFSFAGPRVGNNAFHKRINKLGVKVLRVVNKNDVAPKVPGMFVNETSTWVEYLLKPVRNFIENLPWTYVHVGVPYVIDNSVSPFLKKPDNITLRHYLEGSYLHVLTGFQGLGKEFTPVLDRDIALVNKGADFLNPKYNKFIPATWFQQKSKGLYREQNGGRWITLPRALEDFPEMEEKARQEAEDELRSFRGL